MSGDDGRPNSEELLRRAWEETATGSTPEPAPTSGPATDPAPKTVVENSDAAGVFGDRPPDTAPRPEATEPSEVRTTPPPGGRSSTSDGATPPRPLASVLLALGAVILLVIGGLVVAVLVDSSRSATSLEEGDCLRAPDADQIVQVDTVECDEPHEFEVMGTVTIGDGPYPGDQQVFETALDQCEAVFTSYMGASYPQPPWYINVFTPSAEGWDAGDRNATCLVFRYTEDFGDFATVDTPARDTPARP